MSATEAGTKGDLYCRLVPEMEGKDVVEPSAPGLARADGEVDPSTLETERKVNTVDVSLWEMEREDGVPNPCAREATEGDNVPVSSVPEMEKKDDDPKDNREADPNVEAKTGKYWRVPQISEGVAKGTSWSLPGVLPFLWKAGKAVADDR